jgi:uncharacterized caspase-like protein
MKKVICFYCLFVLLVFTVAAQQKYALVMGNGAYRHLTKLNNPVNDANDMKKALQGLGFNVDTVVNGNRIQMEEAIERFRNKLSVSKNCYGFLFYAGHGVQSGGINYLIPVDADIKSEAYLRDRAVSVQAMLDEINDAGNELNIIVLDACRDNPFSWNRSSSRGLQLVSNQPADSIIVYATAAGATAADGTGRNGLFTSQLLKNIKTPGLEVNEIFRLTGGDVAKLSGGNQRPAVYNQFYGIAYLGSQPSAQTAQPAQPQSMYREEEEFAFPSNFIGTWKRDNFNNTLTIQRNTITISSRTHTWELLGISGDLYTLKRPGADQFTIPLRLINGTLIILEDTGTGQENWNGTWKKQR